LPSPTISAGIAPPGRPPGRRRRARDALLLGARDVSAGDDRGEQEHERGRIEQPLRDDRAENLAPPRRRALAQEQDAQNLPAARRQDRVSHVADGREPVRVGWPVLDVRAPENRVPAPAADQRRDAVQRHGGDQRAPLGRLVGQLGRLLAQRPPDHAGERHDRDRDRPHRCTPRLTSSVRGAAAEMWRSGIRDGMPSGFQYDA
jgi:hypothetical protein